MKRITALLLAVLCMLSVCACNNGSKAADVSAKDLIAATMNSAKPESADTLYGSDDQSFKNRFYYYYGIETDAVRDYAIAYSSAAKSDEISVLVAAKGTDMKTLTDALEGRREMQRQTFELYSPESVEMLKNAVIFTQGDYAVMIVAKDPTSIESRVKELLSDASAVEKEAKAYYDTAVTPTVTSKPEKAYDYSLPVPATEAKDNSWFKDAAFVGDSRMEGIMNYADFEHSSNFSHVGLNVADVFTKPYIKTESGTVTVADALRNDLKYGKVYVMLGINELGWYNLDKFIEYYGNIVDLLRETHPEAQIYIISILPVGAKATASQEMLNNDRVQMFNERIQGMCSEKQVYFVNGFEALAVNGSLPDDASPDGVHMQPSYCHKLTDYLLTHTVSA